VGNTEEPIPRDEYRCRETEILFGIELLLYRWGLSEFAFDEGEHDFQDREGKVVLSRHHADRDRLFGPDGHAQGGSRSIRDQERGPQEILRRVEVAVRDGDRRAQEVVRKIEVGDIQSTSCPAREDSME
jgi:hypothetical protein